MKTKIFTIFAAVLCLCALCAVAVSAEGAPETDIVAHNLSLNDSVNIIYYADFQNVPENAEKGILIWTSVQDEYVYGSENAKLTNIRGTYAGYSEYAFTGVSAKMMSQDIYAKSYIKVGDEITYGPLDKYSVLQYCYNKKGSTTTVNGGTKTLGELVEKMLEYGAWAQEYFNYNTDRMANATYYKINVVNGALADGTTGGLYPVGADLTLNADAPDGAIVFWENSAGNVVGTTAQLAISAPAKNETYSVSHILEWVEGTPATCTENGVKGYYDCSICGKKFDAEYNEVTDLTIAALGHSWDDGVVTTPATTTATGVMTYTCAVCGATKTEEIPVEVTLNYSKGLEYTSNGDGTCYVSDIGDCTDTEIVIPEESPDGETVTGIGQEAFSYCSNITSIYVPDSVTSIGNSAFYRCNKLTDITIGNGVENVGSNVFYNCPIENVTIHTNAISFIPKNNLKTVVIIGGTSIGNSAFSGCSSLTSIEIPASVTSIGNYAFRGCSSLESITIPFVGNKAGITSSSTYQYPFGYIFGESSYTGGTATKQYYYGSSTSSRTYSTYYIPSSLKSVTVTGGYIPYGAFYNCSKLTSITIGEGVTSIGDYAFFYCRSLTSIDIPASVTSIGECAFYDCYFLTSIEIPASVKSIGDYAFRGCSKLTSIEIPSSVTSIGSDAFSGCSSLTSVTFAENSQLTSIGSDAFSGCSSLTSVNITNIAQWCAISFGYSSANPLYYAHNLYLNGELVTELVIPEGVTRIGERAFYECSSLTSIEIPASVTSIDDYAFRDCSSLTSVTFAENSKLTSTGMAAFYNCSSLTSIEIPSSVTSIGGSAFYNCSSLTSIDIPASVTSIGDYAFKGCSSLTSIEIPSSVTSIGYNAFEGCSSLTSIEIPTSVTNIGSSAFNACPIETATIPTNAISYIPKGKLKTVIINGGASIDSSTFSGCTALTSITIPTSVTNIGSNAFSGCSSLTSIVYQGTKSQWKAINKAAGWDDNMGDYTLYFEN